MKTCLLLLAGLLATAVAVYPPYGQPPNETVSPNPGCPYGQAYLDACTNVCKCVGDLGYACQRKACPLGYVISQPHLCTSSSELPRIAGKRVYCHQGIVKIKPRAPSNCQYGRAYLDQCENVCFCQNGRYKCKARATPAGGVCFGTAAVGKPVTCEVEGEIRVESHTRFFCEGNIIHLEYVEDHDRCTGDASWKLDCNTCWCGNSGPSCTRIGCTPPTGRTLHIERPSDLKFGDVLVPEQQHCPANLREVHGQFGVKVCKAEGCTPGVRWQLNDCIKCVCTKDGEPACTPCARKPTSSTVHCDGGIQCPQDDCGRSYSPEKDCYECKCGVGEPGDVHVEFGERCPQGFDHRVNGAFFKACGLVDQLPRGDTKECLKRECDSRCIFVRRSDNGCVFCQCEGNTLVPSHQVCPPTKVEGPKRQDLKVCKAANRQECSKAGTEYKLDCDTCICQDNGVPACTKRDCKPPISPYPGCPYGPAYLDECTNVCKCAGDSGYACEKKACPPDYASGQPHLCTSSSELPRIAGQRVFCHQNIVKTQPKDEPCVPYSTFLDEQYCNKCRCIGKGPVCTKKFCLSPNTGY